MSPRQAAVIILAFALALPALGLWGCAAKRSEGDVAAAAGTTGGEAFDVFSGEYENTPAMLADPPRSVAVLPFGGDPERWVGKSGPADPRPAVRRAMYNHLSSLPFRDQELHETDARLTEAGLGTPEAVARVLADDPARLAALLDVDAVVTGEVTHYDRAYAGVVSQAAVGCAVRMTRLPDGEQLWRATHVSRGFGGGLSISPIGIVLSAFSSLWNLRDEQLQRETDALFREIVSTIHAPGAASLARTQAPRIDLFAVTSEARSYPEGTPVVMRLVGDPGGRASAEISGTGKVVDLVPAPPASRRAIREQLLSALARRYADLGVKPERAELEAALEALEQREIYEGAYYPEPGVEEYGATVRGTLAARTGARSTRLLAERIDVDAAPPDAPDGLRAEAGSHRVRLAWNAVNASDLAAYEVLASASGLSGFTVAARSAEPSAVVDGLPDFSPVFLRVAAVDRAGNRSLVSRAVKALPLPEPDLAAHAADGPRLGGVVDGTLFLPADLGPYLVTESLVVPEGAALHIAPDAVVRFAPGTGLAVAGGTLSAWGEAQRPVRLVPESPASRPGTWNGVLLDGAARARLTGTHILGARTGLTVRRCAPRIDGCVIRASSQAGVALSDGARPSITCTLIRGNGGMGGMVAEGGGLDPALRGNTFSANEPFHVQNFSPVELDLSGNHWSGDTAAAVLGRVTVAPTLPAPPEGCAPARGGGRP